MMIDEARHFDMRVFLAFLSIVHSDEIKEIWHFASSVNAQIKRRGKDEDATERCLGIEELRSQIALLEKDRKKWEFRVPDAYRLVEF